LDSKQNSQHHSYEIDWQQYILFIYSDKEIIIYLFDEAHTEHYTKKRKNLIRSPISDASKRSHKCFSRNDLNHVFWEHRKVDGDKRSYPENQNHKISHAFEFVVGRIGGYFVEQ